MKITYASHHNWYKKISEDPLDDFGKNNKARIKSTINRVPEYDITHQFIDIDENFYSWFVPMYNEKIGSKNNPSLFDIKNVVEEQKAKYPYKALTLFQNNTPLGATIFSDRGNRFSVAYRVYEYNWIDTKLPATPTFYTEYLLCQYSIEHGKNKMSHGKDRNPYGVNSDIGLCSFKLTVGCYASVPKEFEQHELESDDIKGDFLVLELPSEGKRITDAHLFTVEERLPKYTQVLNYEDRLRVHTHLR